MKGNDIKLSKCFYVSSFAVLIAVIIVYKSWNFDSHLPAKENNFWKRNVIYQIYPRSFYDHNGDGIGDLMGIASKANYFQSLGVGIIWISPIFESPMKDFGYDVSNFTKIDPIFGSMEDFEHLLSKMHEIDIKVVLDFVPNHSSDEHEWFKKSVKRHPKYADFYIWKDPRGYNDSGDPIPPNNWLSRFRFSAWTWSEERKQFYFHQYLKEQPDLNYRNPDVVEEMNNVLRFWLNKGVDGFRIDALKCLFEVEDVYQDEPRDFESGVEDPTNFHFLKHIYTESQPETFDVLRGWRKIIDEYGNKVIMVEVYDKYVEPVMKYYGTESNPLADFPFNFFLMKKLRERGSLSGTSLKESVDSWIYKMPPGKWPTWLLGSHDESRVASRLGSDLVDAVNMFTLLLPGTPVTYYGEEIGMENTFITFEETQDPRGRHYGPSGYLKHSRDKGRTPMQWNDSQFAGFTQGNSTWLPVNKNYVALNMEAQNKADQSHIKVYKAITKLRLENTFQYRSLDFLLWTDDIVAYMRSYKADPKYIIVVNTSVKDRMVELKNGLPTGSKFGSVVIRSSSDHRHETEHGALLNLAKLDLLGGEGLVLRLQE